MGVTDFLRFPGGIKMARLPYEEQKALASTTVVECLNKTLEAINHTVTSFEIERLNAREIAETPDSKVDRLNSVLLELDKTIMNLGIARAEIRERMARLRDECPEVVANWKGPAMELSGYRFQEGTHDLDT